jgi:hypothetical protein
MIDRCKATEAFNKPTMRDQFLRAIGEIGRNTGGPVVRRGKPVFVVGATELAIAPFDWWVEYHGGNCEVVRCLPLDPPPAVG